MNNRDLRSFLIALLGISLLVGAPLVLHGAPAGMMLVMALGVGLLLFNVWKEQRVYYALRREVEAFHRLVQKLNAAALDLKHGGSPESEVRLDEIRARMKESVDRMAQVAGQTAEEVEAEELGRRSQPE